MGIITDPKQMATYSSPEQIAEVVYEAATDGDAAVLPAPMLWFVRVGVPLAAILISAGFFFSVLPPTAAEVGSAVLLIYIGAFILAISVVSLGIGLLRTAQPT